MNKLMKPGVWSVLATPFTGSTFDVDEIGIAQLTEHAEGAGAVGLTVLGVFGEAKNLSWEERRVVLETVLESSDLPLIVGCTNLATAPVIDEARLAVELVGDRLAGVMVQANSADTTTLHTHLRGIHEATGADIVLQDYPAASGVTVPVAVLSNVVKSSPNIVAVKAEASPSASTVHGLVATCDIPVFGGLGGLNLLDELACGAAGAMTGFSYPEALVACVNAWKDGAAASRAAILDYLPLIAFEQQAGIALAIRKECLRRRGLISESDVRPPARRLPDSISALLGDHISAVEAIRAKH